MKTAPWIIIVVLLVVIFFLRECSPKPEPCPKADTITIIQVDTFFYPVFDYIPKIITKTEIVEVVKKVDTAEIIRDYLTLNFYSDTLINDSNAYILVEDTVGYNRILSRIKTMRLYPRTIYNTKIVEKVTPQDWRLFAGFGVGRSPNRFGLAASLLFISRKQTAYSVSYDALNKDAYLIIYFKIK